MLSPRHVNYPGRQLMMGTTTSVLIRCALAVAALTVPPPRAVAQTVTGTLQGTVTDTSGGVLPGVSMTVTHVETGAERALVTNGQGFYSAPFVPIGQYRITAALAGFGTVSREGIQVGLNDTRVVDFTLNPRATESVTVKADAPPINVTSGEVRSSLTAEQIM